MFLSFAGDAMRKSWWIDVLFLVVLFGLAMRYGLPNLVSYPLALVLSWHLSAPQRVWGRRVLSGFLAALTIFLTVTGLYTWLIARASTTGLRFITLHSMAGAHFMLLCVGPVARHLQRTLKLSGAPAVSGHAAMWLLRLTLWPATIVGTIAIGPPILRPLHLWLLVPAALGALLHSLHPLLRRMPVPYARKPALVAVTVGTLIGVVGSALIYRVSERRPAGADVEPASIGKMDYAPAAVETEGGLGYPLRRVGNSARCGAEGCHPRVHTQWNESGHRHSANIFYQRAAENIAGQAGWKVVRFCAGCHDPVSLITGYYEKEPEKLFGPTSQKEGVSCIVCHKAAATPPSSLRSKDGEVKHHPDITPPLTGNASYFFKPPGFDIDPPLDAYSAHVLREEHRKDMLAGPQEAEAVPEAARTADPAYADPKLCGECHTVHVPQGDGTFMVEQDTFGEWSQGPFADHAHPQFEEEKACAECHMAKVEDPDRPGPKEASHRFPGGNTHVAAWAGHPEQVRREQEFLKNAGLRLEIENLSRVEKGVKFDVVLKSEGVGHGFPSGAMDLNESWIEVSGSDGAEPSECVQGCLGEDGKIGPGGLYLRRLLADAKGNPVLDHNLLLAKQHTEDASVPPRGEIRRTVVFPGWFPYVTIRLLHRGVNLTFLRWALGDSAPLPPVTVLAERTKRMPE